MDEPLGPMVMTWEALCIVCLSLETTFPVVLRIAEALCVCSPSMICYQIIIFPIVKHWCQRLKKFNMNRSIQS